MTVPWSLTITLPNRIGATVGIEDDHDAAVTAVLAAVQTAIEDARVSAAFTARYELRAATNLVAIIQTGVDEDGSPDHVATGELVARIETERYFSTPPG